MTSNDEDLMRRIRHDPIDSYDEELEMAWEDRTIEELAGEAEDGRSEQDKDVSGQYFLELFRLQG